MAGFKASPRIQPVINLMVNKTHEKTKTINELILSIVCVCVCSQSQILFVPLCHRP